MTPAIPSNITGALVNEFPFAVPVLSELILYEFHLLFRLAEHGAAWRKGTRVQGF